MLKNLTQLEVKIGEKLYHIICDQDSPLEHVKEALFQFCKVVGQIEDATSKPPVAPVPPAPAAETTPSQ